MSKPTVPRVWMLVVGVLSALMVGLCWSWSSPVGAAPDDDYHLASIWCPHPAQAYGCQTGISPDTGETTVMVPETISDFPCYANQVNRSGACTGQLSDQVLDHTTRYDRGDYPGGYYKVMHLLVGPSTTVTTLAIRSLNVVIAVAFLGAGLVLAPTPARRAMAYAGLATMVPLGLFLLASVNPSSWVITGSVTLVVALHSMARTATTRARVANAVLALAAAMLAASARSDAFLFIGLAIGCAVTMNWRFFLRAWRWLAVPLTAALIAVFWLLQSAQAGRAAVGAFGNDDPRYPTRWEAFLVNLVEIPQAANGIFGGAAPETRWGLGWFDTPMPGAVYVFAAALASGLVMLGALRVDVIKAFVVGVVVFFMAAWPLYMVSASQELLGYNFQPRYLVPAAFFALFFWLQDTSPDGAARLRGAQPALAWGLLTVAHCVALFMTLHRFTVGAKGPMSLSGRTWWWAGAPAPWWVWLLGSLAFAALASGFWVVSRAPKLDGATRAEVDATV